MKNYCKKFRVVLIFFAFTIWFLPANAQLPHWDWAVGIEGATTDQVTAVTSRNGKVYVCGTFSSPYLKLGNDTLFNTDTNSIESYWARYDTAGTLIWAKSGQGENNDEALAIATDGFGNVIIAGAFQSSSFIIDSDTLISHDLSQAGDIFVIKFDPSGTLLWARNFEGNFNEVARAVSVDNAGNIYLAGDFRSDTIFFDGYHVLNDGLGNDDGFIAKLDPQGQVLWAKPIAGQNSVSPTALSSAQNNSIVLGGYFDGDSARFDTTVLFNHGGLWDLFVAKYDTSGDLIWARNDGSFGDERSYTVACDTSGNVTIAGWFEGDTLIFGNTILLNSGSADVLILRYDSFGNRDTAWSTGGIGYDYVTAAAIDTRNGCLYLSGNYNSDTLFLGSFALVNPGGIDRMFLAKIDSQDDVVLGQDLGNTDFDEVWSAAVDEDGNLYVGGYFNSPALAFGTNVIFNTGLGNGDGFFAKLDTSILTRTHDVKFFNNSFEVYPNPSTGIFRIESLNQGQKLRLIQVFDIQGKLIYQQEPELERKRWQIEMNDASAGMYFLRLTAENGNETRKIIISEK